MKPFVYAAALDHGMTPASIIIDGPFCVYQSALLGQKCFRNFSGGYAGPQTMRWGVEQSRNLMTVRAASQTGMGERRQNREDDGHRRLSRSAVDRARRRGTQRFSGLPTPTQCSPTWAGR